MYRVKIATKTFHQKIGSNREFLYLRNLEELIVCYLQND